MRLAAVLLALAALIGAGVFLFGGSSAPVPALIAGLPDDGLRGAPCPARTLLEQNARRKQGAHPAAALAARLQQLFPTGSDAGPLENRLKTEGFDFFAPCPNDDGVFGARWLSKKWGQPDAFVYWRTDDANKLTFLDGHVSRTE
ncbi:MAG TPA: hypothetical protein VMU18_04775 [Rhodoblastus sp.]|nr:hypothetical protein [Rhodoblastus sp.]